MGCMVLNAGCLLSGGLEMATTLLRVNGGGSCGLRWLSDESNWREICSGESSQINSSASDTAEPEEDLGE